MGNWGLGKDELGEQGPGLLPRVSSSCFLGSSVCVFLLWAQAMKSLVSKEQNQNNVPGSSLSAP